MRRLMLVLSTAVVMGCAKKEETPPEVVTEPPAPVAPAPIDMAAVAGTWEMKTMGATSDSVLTTFTLEASADTAGWLMAFPKRTPMKLSITVSGDSIMSVSPQYESVLRKGAKVQTNTVFHLVGDKLVGRTTAHYTGAGADSVVTLRSEGTKLPK
ncbi:MAG: hypothetical protein IPO52_00190 [Gemmatimonadetes bacterium]|nr:hypothetical protein [Gemmatimonadota bacterium]MBP6569839.1 hypothetical protein [Gemmatimonadales bacterium]MBP7622228.1 hypothetical protein [Gemmatimonadales bacterium]MBP9897561.1 hypothetical protein [Gemmatimonadales bacterium]